VELAQQACCNPPFADVKPYIPVNGFVMVTRHSVVAHPDGTKKIARKKKIQMRVPEMCSFHSQ